MIKRLQLNRYGEDLGGMAAYRRAQNDAEDAGRAYRRQTRAVLRNVVDHQLTPRQRQMVRMYYYERKSMPRIAAELGVNKSTVSRTVARARRVIARCMNGWV